MIYYSDNNILIRSMVEDDAQRLADGFKEQGWHKTAEQFEEYLKDQNNNTRYIFVAEYQGEVAGYTTLLPKALSGPFADKGFPEICDFNVLIKYQKRGIGNKILDAAENVAAKISNTVSLGVGLHHGYGAAQRIYVKRGYIPDGSGVWYIGKQLEQYTDCCNDDDLVLYMSKSLI